MATVIQKAIQRGLKALRTTSMGIQQLCQYTSATTTTYSATAGTFTQTTAELEDVPVVMTQYEIREIDGEAIRPEDQKALIAVLDLSVEPTINDWIELADSTRWTVVQTKRDPARGMWVLQVRRP